MPSILSDGSKGRCWSRGVRRVQTASPADKNLPQLPVDNPDALDNELNPPPTKNGTTP